LNRIRAKFDPAKDGSLESDIALIQLNFSDSFDIMQDYVYYYNAQYLHLILNAL